MPTRIVSNAQKYRNMQKTPGERLLTFSFSTYVRYRYLVAIFLKAPERVGARGEGIGNQNTAVVTFVPYFHLLKSHKKYRAIRTQVHLTDDTFENGFLM